MLNSIFTATAKDLSNTDVDNQDKCNCSEDLERCLSTTSCSTEDMISRFENCLKEGCCPHVVTLKRNDASKAGCCPHVVPLENRNASRAVSGFYWVHLAIILNKMTLFKELIPYFLMWKNKSYRNWFTVDNGYSVLYLLSVHSRPHMLLAISKYIEDYEIKGDIARYCKEPKMNIADSLRVGVKPSSLHHGVTNAVILAFDARSYESLDFLLNYDESWCGIRTGMLETALRSGNIDFYI